MAFNQTQYFEVIADDGTCWEIGAEIEFNISGGCAPWKGSVYSCPSDVDWYGDPGDLEIESVTIESVTEHDDDGNATPVELDAWEEPIVLSYANDHIDEDDLYEAAGEQADDDFDPPEPDYDEPCHRYYDGTGSC